MKTFASLGALAALFQQAAANLDVVTLFAKADAYIQEASATLVLGDIPNPITGDVALWSAIMMQNQDSFLQGVTQNSPEGLGYCSNLGNKWCNFAYALINGSKLSGQEWNPSQGLSRIPSYDSLQAQLANANVGSKRVHRRRARFHRFDQQGTAWRDLLHLHGVCSRHLLHYPSSHQADESFGHNGGWKQGATGGEMSTSDGGKTWKFTTLEIPATDVPRR
uniref:WGS project CBMG000000000 data, contig CS5907-c002047 n=1 Tax=Fusarium acuminatum CS5907 TaxID=1318461 RepID=A0A090MDJ7_9HYPO|nr:unnamed protein product [Fusarium acuminatum CS5907]